MAEDHRLQEPRLCANFFHQNSSAAKYVINITLTAATAFAVLSHGGNTSPSSSVSQPPHAADLNPDPKLNTEKQALAEAQQDPKRCLTCRRRVGITGFRCKCGFVFCGKHRYPELHQCSFDFKRMGKEKIAKANPKVIAKKLEKI